jgi:hypothetical protein
MRPSLRPKGPLARRPQLAGALLDIAGGAIIAAVQEAMHLSGRPEPAA